jgi:regulatory protein
VTDRDGDAPADHRDSGGGVDAGGAVDRGDGGGADHRGPSPPGGEIAQRVVRLADLAGAGPAAPVASLRGLDPEGEPAPVVDLRAWARGGDPAPARRRARPRTFADAPPSADRADGERPARRARQPRAGGRDTVGGRDVLGPRDTSDGRDAFDGHDTLGGGDSERGPGDTAGLGGPGDTAGPGDTGGLGDTGGPGVRGGRRRGGRRSGSAGAGGWRRAPTTGGEGAEARAARERRELEADPVAVAREICLRLLTERARTRQELAQALRKREVPDEAANAVLERFDEVGLIDDAAFAGQWVRSRHTGRGLARRAIAVELRRKGVADEVAQEALAEVDTDAEEQRARELVDRKLRTVPADTPERRTTAARRLVGMLARRGYPAGVAYRVVREALAAHGAEEAELGEPDL